MRPFTPARDDGRSGARVLLDYISGSEPGRLFTYAELLARLDDGGTRAHDVKDLRSVLTGGFYSRLLREQARALHNVRRIGYRLAPASEHRSLALARKSRADTQLGRGVDTLRNVDWSALDPAARAAHEGTLLIMSDLYERQRAMEKRQESIERVIRNLVGTKGDELKAEAE